jgi:hypothetical protein
LKERRDERVEREKVERGCDVVTIGAKNERGEKEDRV